MTSTNNQTYYDEEVDIIMLSKGQKVQHSVDCDPFIIDVDFSGAISGVEILDATNTLKLDVETLKSLKGGRIQVQYKQNNTLVSIYLTFQKNSKEIEIPIKVNLGKEHTLTEKAEFCIA